MKKTKKIILLCAGIILSFALGWLCGRYLPDEGNLSGSVYVGPEDYGYIEFSNLSLDTCELNYHIKNVPREYLLQTRVLIFEPSPGNRLTYEFLNEEDLEFQSQMFYTIPKDIKFEEITNAKIHDDKLDSKYVLKIYNPNGNRIHTIQNDFDPHVRWKHISNFDGKVTVNGRAPASWFWRVTKKRSKIKIFEKDNADGSPVWEATIQHRKGN